MKKVFAILIVALMLLSTPAMAISDKAHTLVSEMQFGKYVHEGGWPEHFINVCGWSEAEFLSALSEATEYAYASNIINDQEYRMYHGYLANNDLGDNSVSLYVLSAAAVLAASGAVLARKKRRAAA